MICELRVNDRRKVLSMFKELGHPLGDDAIIAGNRRGFEQNSAQERYMNGGQVRCVTTKSLDADYVEIRIPSA
jgi:hypothetical protein